MAKQEKLPSRWRRVDKEYHRRLHHVEAGWPVYQYRYALRDAREVLNLPQVHNAAIFYMRRARTLPSHNFYHARWVAETAVRRAIYDELSLPDLRMIGTIGFFHDLIRSSQRVSDDKGLRRSLSALREFARANKLNEKNTAVMMAAIAGPKEAGVSDPSVVAHAKKLSDYLEFADFLHFLNGDRILAFAYENRQLRKLPFETIEGVYVKKFGGKFDHLSPEAQEMLMNELKIPASTPPNERAQRVMDKGREAFTVLRSEGVSKQTPEELSRVANARSPRAVIHRLNIEAYDAVSRYAQEMAGVSHRIYRIGGQTRRQPISLQDRNVVGRYWHNVGVASGRFLNRPFEPLHRRRPEPKTRAR